MENWKTNKKIGLITMVVIFGVIIYFMVVNAEKINTIVTPFIIGLIIAYLLNPLVKGVEKRKVPRVWAIIIIMLAFVLLTVLVVNMIVPVLYINISDLISNIPNYTSYYNSALTWLQSKVSYSNIPDNVKEMILSQAKESVQYIQGVALNALKNTIGAVSGVVSFFINFILGIIIAFYFLKDKERFKMQANLLLPRKWRDTATSTLGEMNVVISNYIQGQLIVIAIVAFLETTGLFIVGVKYALLLGIIGGIANIIPYFGPFIGGVPAVAIALLDSPQKALFALLVFVIVQQIDNSLISPRIMSEKIGLHPVTIMFVMLFFGAFFGLVGLIVAVPLSAIIKIIANKVIERLV